MGTLAWTGNFRFTFEVDNKGYLRIISGINPYASQYAIKRGESFKTPEFIFTLSNKGTGYASRNLHDWARNYQIKNGKGERNTLLNNWEATYFDFNEDKLVNLIADAKNLGVDMFLLDDGWFGNKYPRHSDTQGLGDWQETANKLPNGIGKLTEEAKKQGVKFGLWIEPEMVNPKSELYEKHKDWVIRYPNRKEYYFRNQMVLDLSNPKVQDYVYGIVDGLLTKYPGIAYFKWDCNSPITNIYSAYEKNEQSRLYIDYVRGLYKVLDRIKAKYPELPMMLCSGGGGRTDYEGLKYFQEMWPSDNTDPTERLFIQWGYSQIFPTKVQCAHVILDGDQYRLVSPYEGNHAATMYVTKDQKEAVVFAFDIYPRFAEKLYNVVMQGLNASATYKVEEINRMDGSQGEIKEYSGNYLMTIGLPMFTESKLASKIFKVSMK